MILLYVLIYAAGALASLAVLWPYGWLVALAGGLLCGNALAALAAGGVFLRTRQQAQTATPILASIPQFSTGLPDLPEEASPPPAEKVQNAA